LRSVCDTGVECAIPVLSVRPWSRQCRRRAVRPEIPPPGHCQRSVCTADVARAQPTSHVHSRHRVFTVNARCAGITVDAASRKAHHVGDSQSTAPVDPSFPVPDVPGADAGAGWLPRRADLTLAQRITVDAALAADLALRTAVASLIGTTMLPPFVGALLNRDASRAERRHLRFYAELAEQRDPARAFPAPTTVPRVTTRPANPVAEFVARGHVHNIRFDSDFEAINPELRDRCRGYRRNNVVRAQHWRHSDGPRPTLCVIHGFMGSAYLANGLFLSLPWFYRSGYDVLLYTLPFHGRRAERNSPFSGYGFFAHGLAGFAEAMAQAVHDFRSLMNYLEFTGVDRIALTGISLGGYTSALLAAVDDRIQAVIPNVPVVTPQAAFDDWFPANIQIGRASRSGR